MPHVAPTIKLTVNEEALADKPLGYQVCVNGEAPTGTKLGALTKSITNSTTMVNLMLAWNSIKPGANVISIRVGYISGKIGVGSGQVTDLKVTEYDEYFFHLNTKPAMNSVKLTTARGETISTNFTKQLPYNTNVITASTNEDTVKLTLGYQGTSYYLIGEDATQHKKEAVEISLENYYTEDQQYARVPITLVYEQKDSKTQADYELFIAKVSVTPVVTTPIKSVTCDKDETPTLAVKVTEPEKIGTLTYQWYGAMGNQYNMREIPGATDTTLKLSAADTTRAGARYYQFVATNTLNGYTFTTYSDVITVNVNLSYVSKPNIVIPTGTKLYDGKNKVFADYNLNYTAGQKCDPLQTAVEKPESGVSLEYAYYCSTTDDFSSAAPLKTKASASMGQMTIDGKVCLLDTVLPVEGFEAGTYYVYCVVTAKAEDGRTAASEPIKVYLHYEPIVLDFKGEGTIDEPYLLSTADDLKKLSEIVSDGQWCRGVYFRMTNDITLPLDWSPIGKEEDISPEGTAEDLRQYKYEAFSGIFDGDGHTVTIAEGGKPLFNCTSDAVIENLNIYGKRIEGSGLIDKYFVDYGDDNDYWTGVPECVTIRNVRLLAGSSTLRSGFMEGSGSGANTIRIENCVVEKGVTVGYDGSVNGIGSFVGSMFNGIIRNCSSGATVYGKNRVGGLAGSKGQSMGYCVAYNSSFDGEIIATGEWVGGLIGEGYWSDSAPNTPPVSFVNCYVAADITGKDNVGGLFGGEPGMTGCINDAYLTDSHFYGKITCEGEHVGGIIGYLASVDKMQHVENNYFYETTKRNIQAIGGVGKYVVGVGRFDLTDAEKTAFESNVEKATATSAEDFAGSEGVVKLLNEGSDYKNWVLEEGSLYPTLSSNPLVSELEVYGYKKTRYKQGEQMDMSSFRFNATWSDGTTTQPRLGDDKENDVWLEEPFDPNHLGVQTLTFHYKSATATVTVSVLKDYTDAERENFSSVEVLFSLSDDDAFKTGTSNTVLANVPMTVKYFDLADYGLEEYYHYENGKLVEQPTVLHLYITAMERFGLGLSEDACGKGTLANYPEYLTVQGGAGHMYMTKFYQHNENLNYYVNGKYPMKPDGSMGATADEIVLQDGDFVDVAMFSNDQFHLSENSGLHFFFETGTTPQKTFRVPHGEELTLSYLLAHGDMNGSGTSYTAVSGASVYSGASIDASAAVAATTGADGKVSLTFETEGTQYVWTKGARGTDDYYKIVVSNPGCATIIVTKTAAEVDRMIADIDENTVTAASGEAIAAARAAYNALSSTTKQQVTQLSKLERLEAKYGPYREVDIVRETIGKLPETADLKLAHRDAVNAAKAAYDKLTAEQKTYLTSTEVTKLNDAVRRIAYLTRYPVTAVTVSPDTITATIKGTTIVLTGYCDKLSDIALYDQDGNALDVQDGRFTAYGVSYSVDTSGVAEKPVNVEVSKDVTDVPIPASGPEKAVAETISESNETKSEGLGEAAGTELISAAKDIAKDVETPENAEVKVTAEPSIKIEVQEFTQTEEKVELKLDITPTVTYTTTVVDKATGSTIEDATVPDPVTKKLENKDIKAPVTISIPLPAGIVPDDNLYVKHELEGGGVEYIRPTFEVKDGVTIATWQQSSFSVVTFLFDARSAAVSIGGRDVTLLPSDVGGDLPTASKDGMIFTGWSFEIDGKKYDGPYTKLTDDLLTAMDKAREITATPNFTERPSSGETARTESPNKPKKDTVTVDASKFRDVSRSDWYYNSVQYALENGLMNGTSDWAFSPNAATTRGMIVTILARLDGVNTSGNPWYAAGRTWAMNAGVSDGTNIEGKITREQLAAMLYRYAKAKGYDVSASADISGYADASSVSGWAKEAMQWAVGAGLINGRTATTLAPQGSATRAEVAAILMRFAQKIAK